MNLVFFILLALEAGWGQLQHCSLCHLPKAAYTSSTLWIIEPSRDVHVFLAFSEWALNSFSMDCHRDLGKMWETNKNTLFQFSTYFHPLQTTHWNVCSFISPTDLLAHESVEDLCHSQLLLSLPLQKSIYCQIFNYFFQKLNFQYPFLCFFWIQ